MGDWIEWKGGKCPVGENDIVSIRLRDGGEAEGDIDPTSWWWGRDQASERDWDIIAYRIHEPDSPATPPVTS